jgi:hypothetical protein
VHCIWMGTVEGVGLDKIIGNEGWWQWNITKKGRKVLKSIGLYDHIQESSQA